MGGVLSNIVMLIKPTPLFKDFSSVHVSFRKKCGHVNIDVFKNDLSISIFSRVTLSILILIFFKRVDILIRATQRH